MLIKIALKNLLGDRLRTFLNVFITSMSFFMIIFITGLYDGMRQHAKKVTIETLRMANVSESKIHKINLINVNSESLLYLAMF